jgi:hypothetical protein
MTLIGRDDSTDFADVFHGIFEEHQVHDCISVVVLSQSLVKSLLQSVIVLELIVKLLIKTTHELGEDKRLRSVSEVLLEVEFGECRLRNQFVDESPVSG